MHVDDAQIHQPFINKHTKHREILQESSDSKPNLDCNYDFQTDLAPNGIPIDSKSIGK